jgi:hypothetical protein
MAQGDEGVSVTRVTQGDAQDLAATLAAGQLFDAATMAL